MAFVTIFCNFLPIRTGREFSLSFLLPDKKSNLPSSHQTRSRSSTDASQREGLKAGEDQDYATSNNGSGEDGESINTKGGVGKFKLMTLKAENLLVHLYIFSIFFFIGISSRNIFDLHRASLLILILSIR